LNSDEDKCRRVNSSVARGACTQSELANGGETLRASGFIAPPPGLFIHTLSYRVDGLNWSPEAIRVHFSDEIALALL
jgi:hypothetical protein